ncbi:MAG: diadenylate cyclase CdaA [Anaerolineales bacterium]|nr:diadenylate cyclase CdaA [Anaerolineales bacterium]
MADTFLSFTLQLVFLFSHMTFSNVVDIVLVASVFFVVFQALHQTRTLQLLRGTIIIAILGAALLVLLPLDTFGWLVRILLLAGAIGLPLLFQDELRRVLTGLGQFGRRRGYGSSFERFKEILLNTARQLASQSTGALIVLEGQTPLEDYIATGIPLQAEAVSAELLLTIFHPNTPLHDGAIVMRGDRVVAASCILPVQTESTGATHLGTRHRAALGLSAKVPDALVIVVSEETGRISVTWAGRIYRGLSLEQLGEWLDRFRDQLAGDERSSWRWLRGGGPGSSLRNLLLAVGLAVVAWVSVVYQTNPPGKLTLDEVTLVVSGPDPGLILVDRSRLPGVVQAQVQSTQSRIATMDTSSVRAELPLAGLPAGMHQVPIQVTLADRFTQILSVTPAVLDVELESELSLTFTPALKILDLEALPPGYTVGATTLLPEQLVVKGPRSTVEAIADVRVEIAIGEHRADFQQTIKPLLLDSNGQSLDGLAVSPQEVLVSVPIRRTFYTSEIGIQADLKLDSLEDGYEIMQVEITPNTVVLAGSRSALDSAGDFLITAPISLTGVNTELVIDAPLLVPEGASALNEQSESVNSVRVRVEVKPVTDFFVLSTSIDVRNLSPSLVASLLPSTASVLLVGPRPLLDEIKKDGGLVVIYLDLEGYSAGIYELPLAFEAPPGVQVQLFPSEVQVTLDEQGGG